MEEMGPWEHVPNLDKWIIGHWFRDEAKVEAEKKKQDPKSKTHWGQWNYRWLWNWGPPRICDFCGSIHPEDAFKLLNEKWELEFAKSYKLYLHPPGTKTYNQAFLASIRDKNREVGQGVPSIWQPTPPVKLYTQHCTDQQIRKLNELLKK